MEGAPPKHGQNSNPAAEQPGTANNCNHNIHTRMTYTSNTDVAPNPIATGSEPMSAHHNDERIANTVDQLAAAYAAGDSGFSLVLHPETSTHQATTANRSAPSAASGY